MMRRALGVGAALLVSFGTARADDAHFDVKAVDAPRAIERSLQRLGTKVVLSKVSCLNAANPDQKDVCTYKAGDGLTILLRATSTAHDVDDVTLICLPKSPAVVSSCVTLYASMLPVFTPSIDAEKAREIVAYISKGMGVGDSAQVMVDDNRYVVQKVMGSLWFNIEPGSG